MKIVLKFIFGIAIVLCFVSCGTSNTSLKELYPKMYEEKPLCILIMPPINNTNNVDSKEFLYASLAKPLCNFGYYVFPPIMTLDFIKSESAYDSERFLKSDLKNFYKYIGADALLFTKINEWSKSALSGEIIVSIDYILKSTKTNEVLFKTTSRIEIDTRCSSKNGSVLADLFGNAIATAVNTALKSQVKVARKCISDGFQQLPYGKYSPKYWK